MITVVVDHCVTEIARQSAGVSVECRRKDEALVYFRSDVVFNCLWEGRTHYDQMLGIEGNAGDSIRLKYGLVVKLDDVLRRLNSFTIIHGPYGSFIISPQHSRAFCSWYPSCMKGMIDYGPVPEAWEHACDGFTSASLIEELRISNLDKFKTIVPSLRDLDVVAVTAGLILAEGDKDITDRDSLFHSRNDRAIRRADGYYSVSTSKYTSAPRNTMLLEQILLS